MDQRLAIVLFVIWLAWVAQAWLSAWNVRFFWRRFDKTRKFNSIADPRATLIVPFKGTDPDLSQTLDLLCTQDYPNYDLVWVIDDAADPVAPLLHAAAARHPQRHIRIMVSGKAGANQGQKTHNQRFVLQQIEPSADDEDVWVFCDSDAVPGRDWLLKMIEPLRRKSEVAMSTGYRWLVPAHPERGTFGGAFWSQVASVINSSVACFLGRERFVYAWGGSMALRVAVAREGKLIEKLRGALTDDYQFSAMSRELGKVIYFVPQALVPTPVDFTWATLLNFAHRQYLITRVYVPRLVRWGWMLTGLYVSGFATAWVVTLGALVNPQFFHPWTLSLPAIVLVMLGDGVRSYYRRQVVREAFEPSIQQQLAGTLAFDRWGTPVWMALNFVLITRAFIGRTMVWRGVKYRLLGPQQCERMD